MRFMTSSSLTRVEIYSIRFYLYHVGVTLGVPLRRHSSCKRLFILLVVGRRLRSNEGYVLGEALLVLMVRLVGSCRPVFIYAIV